MRPPPELSFARTVDRTLVHRRNRGEVFLTDAVRTGPREFTAAALLPQIHPHYSAHTGPSRRRDPMLLLECARQAVAYAAHAVFGVDKDARLVLRSWTATFATAAAAKATSKLLLTAAVRPGQASALEYDLELWAAGAWAGRVRMEVGHLSAATYTVIRSRRHGSLPTPADLVPTIGRPVPPARVGRVRSADTLLLDAKATRSTAAARLRVPLGNPSLFDHVQDHVPAMVLVEAARQLAAFALREWGGAPPNQSEMVAMRSSFDRFAELTEPVTMLASPATPAGGRPVDVTFRQARTDVAQVRVVMAAEASQQPAVITRRAA